MTEPTPSVATNQRKLLLVGGLVALLVIVGLLYLTWASTRVSNDLADREARALAANDEFQESQVTPTPPSPESTPVPTSLAPLPGEVLFVNRVPGDDYGRLGIRHSDGSRTLLDHDCLRVHAGGDHGVCLGPDPAFPGAFTTTFFEIENPAQIIKAYASALPSRTRISPSGAFSSVTAFASGSSYEDISTDTTTLVTIDEIDTGSPLTSPSRFVAVGSDDERYENFDVQFWGITWVNDDDFYVTAFYEDYPEIMQGSLNDRTLTPTGHRGSCPSLSPDGKTLVFKESLAEGGFKLVAIDLDTQEKWDLSEMRSVDDQVEWLDDDTILYALHTEDGDTPVQPGFDIWMVDIAEGSVPELFLPNSDSPAVVR